MDTNGTTELAGQEPKPIEHGENHVVQHVIASAYAGPLPSPEAFARYEQVCAGAADRIISMAEKQAAHRQALEKLHEETVARNSKMGILCALLIAMSVLVGGVACIITDHDLAGGLIVGIDIVGLCAVFIYGTKTQEQ